MYTGMTQRLLVSNKNMAYKLNKSLYELKRASSQWYGKLAATLYSRGYSHTTSDYLLVNKNDETCNIFVSIYVDDKIMTGTDLAEIQSLKVFPHDQFKIKNLGKLLYFLGLEILYTEEGVLISQQKFVIDLIKEFECSSYCTITAPLDPNMKPNSTEGQPLVDPTFYRKLIEKLKLSHSHRKRSHL